MRRLFFLAFLGATARASAALRAAKPPEDATSRAPPPERGVLIYAVGKKYVNDGVALASTIRGYDRSLSILFGYFASHHENETISWDELPVDDYFEARPLSDPHETYKAVPNPMARLRYGRMDLLAASPFELTLYVDADALACRSVRPIFDNRYWSVRENHKGHGAQGEGMQWAFTLKGGLKRACSPGLLAEETQVTQLFQGAKKALMPAPAPADCTLRNMGHPFGNAGLRAARESAWTRVEEDRRLLLYKPFEPEVKELLRVWRKLYGASVKRGQFHDQPSHWVATHSVRGLKIAVLDDTAACRERHTHASCSNITKPTNLRSGVSTDRCVFLHGRNVA